MKAGIFYKAGCVGIEELPKPVPGPDEVIVKVLRAGICGSEVGCYRCNDGLTNVTQKGDRGADGQFGHELVGMVDSWGEKVTGVNKGDLVFVNPATAKKGGLAAGMKGAFSEYMVVEDGRYGYNLEVWDKDIDLDRAVLMEPMSVAVRGKNQAQVKPEDNVVIYGGGAIGLCALAAVLSMGCKNPVVVDRHEEKAEVIRKMGGTPFNAKKDGDIAEFLMKHFGTSVCFFGAPRVDVDAFIDCAGGEAVITEIFGMAKEGARISLVGGYHAPVALDLSFMGAMEYQIRGSRAYEKQDVEEAKKYISEGTVPLDSIITHRFKLDDISNAFETAVDKKNGVIKAVIEIAEP